jgi:ABC-type branched-subunit amino acid transport system substrate-binding protein
MRFQYLALVVAAAVAVPAPTGPRAQPDEKVEVARDLAARVGQILGAAVVCRDIAPSRIQNMSDKLNAVFSFTTSSTDDLHSLKQIYDKNAGDGQRAVSSRRKDCAAVERDLADLENAIRTAPAAASNPAPNQTPNPAAGPAPSPAAGAAARPAPGLSGLTAFTGVQPPAASVLQAPPPARAMAASPAPAPPGTDASRPLRTAVAPAVSPLPAASPPLQPPAAGASARGVTADEIRFGIAAPFTGATKELGLQMKLGIEVAFNEANARGGVNGRMLRLVSADDGYEPGRSLDAMRQLYETDQVFGVIGNVGTPTAEVALPFALEHRMLFYGAFTGANLLRRDPPDRYVFNYRPSYAEETDAVVRYLVRLRKLRPEQIAVFAQQDGFGDAGFAGVAKAMRALRGGDEGAILRLNYKRNTIDVDEAVTRLRQSKTPIKAVVMVATYRAAARFIEKTRDAFPGMIYTNVSFVGSSALAEELMLLGPRFANGVIVTQVVPPVESYASVVLDYKNALATYGSSRETPDYVSFEGYLSAKVLIEALRRSVPQLDVEKVVEALETLRDYDIGLGAPVNFSRTEHQALHRVWGTQLDTNGRYQPIELQ